MWLRKLFRQQPGRPIQAATINRIADVAEWSTRLRVSPPLVLKNTPGGPLIGLSSLPAQGFLAVANGNIPARSGSAAGVGSVFMVTTTATFTSGVMSSLALSTGSQDIAVYNPSSTTMTDGHGIDSGQYCWVQVDQNGNLMVTPLECS